MGSKPPAAVGVRIPKGERHDFGTAAPLPIKALSLEQGRAGGPVKSSPKLAELSGRGRPRSQKRYLHALLELLYRHLPCAS